MVHKLAADIHSAAVEKLAMIRTTGLKGWGPVESAANSMSRKLRSLWQYGDSSVLDSFRTLGGMFGKSLSNSKFDLANEAIRQRMRSKEMYRNWAAQDAMGK